ncbi:GNAT family N-acetyltransferase [Microtetraspora fusca]|uniref:GNAT family N-acetyltransferase n=1 Tax=Microtetraspora fusca TaxID=1997 RepID=UPI001FE1685E|nr:GNAT family N-acetyltransferase [Microtetraspora fusca]
MTVVVSPESWLCPSGWTGVVTLDGAALVTVPDASLIEPLRHVLLGDLDETGIDLSRLPVQLPVHDVLGPATLAYLDADDFAPIHVDAEVERLSAGHRDIDGLVAAVDKQDADESGMEEVTSAAWVIREGKNVIAAAGYRPWLNTAAHLSVLTAVKYRGRGLARLVASAAIADALADGLLPQWRARPEPSRRVARALGFREFGSQMSLLVKY